MIGWGLVFIEEDGLCYGTGTSCWFSIEVSMAKEEGGAKFKKLHDGIVASIMKYKVKNELRGLTLDVVKRIPADSTMIVKDGDIVVLESNTRIHRVTPSYKPWPLMYTDQGPQTMDLDELEEWAYIENIKDKNMQAKQASKKSKKKVAKA